MLGRCRHHRHHILGTCGSWRYYTNALCEVQNLMAQQNRGGNVPSVPTATMATLAIGCSCLSGGGIIRTYKL